MPGLAQGFMDGYGFASNIADRRQQREIQKQQRAEEKARYEDKKKQRNKLYGLKVDEIEHQRAREKIEDARYDQKYADNQAWRKQKMGLQRAGLAIRRTNAATSARRNQLAAQKQEIEMADAARQRREQMNRRKLTAALADAKANGGHLTPRALKLAREGGHDFAKQLDPKYRQAQQTIEATLSGAPIRHDVQIDAVNTLLDDRIEAPVGTKDKNGNTIIRTKLHDFIVDPEDETVKFQLDAWTRDKNGKVGKYQPPITSNRSADDYYVLSVPLDKVMAKVKGMDLINKMFSPQQIEAALKQDAILNGANDSGGEGTFVKAGNGMFINNKTARKIKTISDEKKRFNKAFDYAHEDMQSAKTDAMGNSKFDGMTKDEKDAWFNKRRRFWERQLTPKKASDTVGVDAQGQPVTEGDIKKTMAATGMTREQVIDKYVKDQSDGA